MKIFKLVLLALVLSFSSTSKAQVSINLNIGTPPAWGPAGYPDARYYYLPDIQSYYDINTSMFICRGPRGWARTRVLPNIYAGFDLYNGAKVVLNFNGNNPYRYYETHRVNYPRGYSNYNQGPYRQNYNNGNHYGEYKHGRSRDREVIYVNEGYRGREYGDRGEGRRGGDGYNEGRNEDRGNGHGNGRGNGRRRG